MIDDDTQLAAALFQMASCADTLEGMRRYAQETEPSVFSATSSGYLHLLRERILEAQQYLERQSLPQGRALEKAAA